MFGLVMIGLGGFILYLVVWPPAGGSEHTRLELFLSELGFPVDSTSTTGVAGANPIAGAIGGVAAGAFGAAVGDELNRRVNPTPPVVTDPNTANGDAVSRALSVVGTPYLFGGTNPYKGIDCSALTQWAFASLGKALPRTAQGQYRAAETVRDPQRGDLVFFTGTYNTVDYISHVGIYLGDGRMVSARDGGVGTDSIDTGYWRSHLVGFGRV